jgi:hypothetical protein
MEEGIAVRVHGSAPHDVGFAAAAGGEEQLAWVIDRALEDRRPAGESRATLWATGGEPLLDRDPGVDLASVDELVEQLPRMGGFDPSAPRWIETARTVETLVADGGLVASRVRTRSWGMALLPSTPGGREQPRTSYGRAPADLHTSDWHPVPPITREAVRDTPPEPLVFVGEAARLLVQGLVSALHGEGSAEWVPVGAGWRVRDDPLHPKGISGGWFDDAGFPAAPVVLADGRNTVSRLSGPGHLKRPSYRDRPVAHPSCLVVFSADEPFPVSATHIVDARLHALAPGHWIVEGDGYVVRDGEAQGWFRGALVRGGPEEIARSVTATAGPARALGPVVTPALVVEGLPLELRGSR